MTFVIPCSSSVRSTAVEVRDVAGDERDRRQLVVGHDLGQPAPVAAEVVGDDRDAVADERPNRPRADATQGAGDEEPLSGEWLVRRRTGLHERESGDERRISVRRS